MGEEGWAGFADAPECQAFVLITPDPAAPSPIEGASTLAQFVADQPPVFSSVPTEPTDTAVSCHNSVRPPACLCRAWRP